ncbi:Flagellum site-determining protein YlxH/ Fe-S cluster assembling factor NBP35 [Sesbania bispinosa]|nr:Flagellum site-determining protein YlxH/ Fe-S cluster assembling factor NBP35 [Sesbania bispinosa]
MPSSFADEERFQSSSERRHSDKFTHLPQRVQRLHPYGESEQVSNALKKVTRGIDWGNLDSLVMDMPPSTSEVQNLQIVKNLGISKIVLVRGSFRDLQ